MASGLLDLNVLNFGNRNFDNDTRVDHNNFGGDKSNSESWNKSRGRRSHGHGHKNHKGRSKDC